MEGLGRDCCFGRLHWALTTCVMLPAGNTDDDMDPSMFSNYRTDCSPDTPLRYMQGIGSLGLVVGIDVCMCVCLSVCRCESGDLSGKHGQLRLFSNVANRATYTFVDSNLHLVGEYSSEQSAIPIWE